jgi:hypothetical protein
LVSANRASGVRVNLTMSRINQQPSVIRFVNELFKYSIPGSIVTPSLKTFVNTAEFTIGFWQIAPRCTGTQNPTNSIEKPAIVLRDATPLTSLPRKIPLDFSPRLI